MKPEIDIRQLAECWHIAIRLGTKTLLASCSGTRDDAWREARKLLVGMAGMA